MSLDGPRDVYIREKRNEIANCELSRKRKLRELYNYSGLLTADRPPTLKDFLISDEPDENERRFLDENDITKGRRFNDQVFPYPQFNASLPASLPFHTSTKPAIPFFSNPTHSPVVNAPPTLEEQLRAASASPSVPLQPIPTIEGPAPKDVTPISKPPPKSPCIDLSSQHRSETTGNVLQEEVLDDAQTEAQSVSVTQPSLEDDAKEAVNQVQPLPQGQPVGPKDAVPPTFEEAVGSSGSPNATQRSKAPHVIHLPPQDVQEARSKETEQKLERARERERKDDERLTLRNANATTDMVSSPSSTVGPYSQATPHAPHHSPDTSPDTESFRDRAPHPLQYGIGLDPIAEKAKEDHEHVLQLQMQEARERARETRSETPEVERQLEDEQAIRLARDGKMLQTEPDPAPGPQVLTEIVEEIAHKLEPDTRPPNDEEPTSTLPADSLPTPKTTAADRSTIESDESLSIKSQELSTSRNEHPTPPADVDADGDDDVEMDDVQHVQEELKASAPQASSPTHMTDCVSSGDLGQKSVSETAGGNTAPKVTLTPLSSNISATASPVRVQSRTSKSKPVSTVIFATKDANRSSKSLQFYSEEYASLQGASQESGRDYLQGLFQFQAHHPPRSQPLSELVASARKTLSTAGTLAVLREVQDYKILKRVYQLQNANRWSLRQLQKSAEPPRPTSHCDLLLKEMKWMQTDFKEERKWKKALASTFAYWCAEYVNSSFEERAQLRVRAKPKQLPSTSDEDMHDAPTPDLIANETESDSFADDDELLSPFGSNPPTNLFSLGFDNVVMKIDDTPASEAMLRELPLYEAHIDGANDVTPVSFCDPAILPISKYITGKLVSQVKAPRTKRSRFDYDSEDEPSTPLSRPGTSAEHSMPSTPGRRLFHRNDLTPEKTDVALFNSENKHVRDRLQAAHQFRPPTEFLMPPVSFFESRNSSQWLWEEDQKLRNLVKEYTFNWSLVAQELSLSSKFVSASGRRTPWECFERWVQLEGLPAEMSKTPYFRTYQNRLEQAQRTVMAHHTAQQQMLQQQAQQGQNVPSQIRRRTTQPIRVERRRDNRHLSLIDGMRKLARKRESTAHKQSEAAKAAALRKANEPAQPKSTVQTPQEWSRMRWEREEKLRQKLQQDAHMRQILQAQTQRQAGPQGQPGVPNGVSQQQPQQRNGTPGNTASVPTPMGNPSAQSGLSTPNVGMTAQQHARQQAMQGNYSNGNVSGVALNNTGVPQAQMQAQMHNPQRMLPPDQVRLAMQRNQQFANSPQQQQYQLQQQQINMASNITASMNMGNAMPNANMIANMNGQNMSGSMMNGMNGMTNNAGSPRMNPQQTQGPARPLSSGHMPQFLQLQNSLKAQHPDWNQEQIQKVASEQLSKFLAKQRAQAMSAATGAASGIGPSPQIANNGYIPNMQQQHSPSPNAVQNYQAQLIHTQRMLSQQRQQAGSPGMTAARPVSRSATPQNPQMGIQSPGVQQAQMARNQ
ncbi:hypothetical protein B0J11DRAFT_520748 [Dendryphion nanum]|uniref:Vacuolar import and degradation protein 21 n=1 Tax=Dendryphion nanum TaxID=256645 RepID=A0A9P9E797_9PLEO|nr:hypothetical protein B0J11DRAFT_520748 [Dendryphion nanum]